MVGQFAKLERGQFFRGTSLIISVPVHAHGVGDFAVCEGRGHDVEGRRFCFITRSLARIDPAALGGAHDGGGRFHLNEFKTVEADAHDDPSIQRCFHALVPRHAVGVVGQLFELWIGGDRTHVAERSKVNQVR